MNCSNCGVQIVRVGKGSSNDRWMHRTAPSLDFTSWDELVYTFCKLSVAEPVIENIDTPLDKAKSLFDELDRKGNL